MPGVQVIYLAFRDDKIISQQTFLLRKFETKEWEQTLDAFSKVSAKNQWLLRYRVSYFQQYINLKTLNRLVYNFLLNNYLFLIHALSILKGSLFKKSVPISDGETVFFLSENITYLQHVVPIIEKYKRERKPHIILCTGVEFKKVKQYLLKSEAGTDRLVRVDTVGGKDSAAIIKWLVFPFLFMADFFLLFRLDLKNRFLIAADFAKFSLVRRVCEKRMDDWVSKVKMLITANDNWMWESTLHEKAKALGIPNYIVQHGFVGDTFYPMVGSKLCVWGEYYYRKMVDEVEAPPEDIIVTGSGYFDKLYHNFRSKKLEKKYVTFMSQPFAKTPLRMGPGIYEETVLWLNALKPILDRHHLELLIKLHPRDKQEFYPDLQNCTFTKNSLPEVLSQSKITLTVDSTSIVEASLFDLPVIQLWNPSFYRFFDLSKSGLSMVVNSEQQLINTVSRLLDEQQFFNHAIERTREGQKHHFHLLGNSLEHFEEIITQKK